MRRCRRTVSRSAAFTLVELVISSAVFAGIVGGAYACLRATLESREMVSERMDVAQTARVALRMLAADLRSACQLDSRFEFIGLDRSVFAADGEDISADNVDFATRRWEPRGTMQSDFCEVSWFVDRIAETGAFGLFRRRDPTPDLRPLEGGSKELIADGLAGFNVEYFDGFVWHETWGREPGGPPLEVLERLSFGFATNLRGLPDAVRITLAFEDPRAHDPERRLALRGEGSRSFGAPLRFQTVVRLDYAGRVNNLFLLEGAGSGASATGASSSTGASGGGAR